MGKPRANSGLTGRKIIVNTCGRLAHHGDGAFSGKDVSKVDRSASYYARYAAKAVVAAKLADRCEICVSYSIGVTDPVALSIDTFGTEIISDERILDFVRSYFDFTPSNICKELDLDKVTFQTLVVYGHMGGEDLPVRWEQVDEKGAELRDAFEKAHTAT